MTIRKHKTSFSVLPVILAVTGCASWGQDDLESARVAHNEAIRYATMMDDCGAPAIAKSQDAIMRLEAIVYRNEQTRWKEIAASSPVAKHDSVKTFEETYPLMFDAKFLLADRLRAENCENKARSIYQQIMANYPEAVFSKYRERASLALSGAQN